MLTQCKQDDPNVCQACLRLNTSGHYYLSEEGTDACMRHGASAKLEAIRRKSANQYKLQVWQSRVNEFTESEHSKSLRGEIGILKMTLENIVNMCQDASQLLLYSGKIGDMVTRIEKLVVACDRLERNMGMMLDKATAMKLAGNIVDLISNEVDDPNTIDRISNAIIDLLKDL